MMRGFEWGEGGGMGVVGAQPRLVLGLQTDFRVRV